MYFQSQFLNNASDFCKGFNEIIPVATIAKKVAGVVIPLAIGIAIGSLSNGSVGGLGEWESPADVG